MNRVLYTVVAVVALSLVSLAASPAQAGNGFGGGSFGGGKNFKFGGSGQKFKGNFNNGFHKFHHFHNHHHNGFLFGGKNVGFHFGK